MLGSNIGYNKAWNLKREKVAANRLRCSGGVEAPSSRSACQDVKSIPCLHWSMIIVGKSDKILVLNQDHCHCCTTSFKAPTLQCAGVWFTTPAMGGAKAGRSSGTFGNPTSDSTFRAWTGQFTLISTKKKKSKVKVCQITVYSPMF